MDKFLKSISYIFHPLFMPLFAAWFYFEISPRFISKVVIHGKLISLGILTVILPVLSFLILKTLGKAKTIHLENTKERIYPLILYGIILLVTLKRVILPTLTVELYFFILGVLVSNLACLFMAFFKLKASLHMAAIAGAFMFFVALSIHFSINLNNVLALMCVAIGAVATSRLHFMAHNYKELILGLFVGILPQLILVTYWL